MKITRNGTDIELTQEEIEKIFQEQKLNHYAEDLLGEAKLMGYELNHEKALELANDVDCYTGLETVFEFLVESSELPHLRT